MLQLKTDVTIKKRGEINRMKLSNIGEVNDFLEVVNRCEGDVWLQSNEGNKIKVKSSLSRSVAVAEKIKNKGKQ